MRDLKAPGLKQDAQGQVIQESYQDYEFIGQYAGTNLIYECKARPGSAATAPVWKIRKMTYDGSNNLLLIQWPKNASGAVSSGYEFIASNRAGYTYV